MKMLEQNLKIIRDYFKDKPIKKAYLFGSQIRHSKPIGLKFVRMQIELEELLKTKVDLLTDRAISKYIKPYVENEKELIYEK